MKDTHTGITCLICDQGVYLNAVRDNERFAACYDNCVELEGDAENWIWLYVWNGDEPGIYVMHEDDVSEFIS